jgi:hypothetical protein
VGIVSLAAKPQSGQVIVDVSIMMVTHGEGMLAA